MELDKAKYSISVIVPIYQVEDYIAQAIESIVNQEQKNIEIVLVDDGTKDESVAIAIQIIQESAINYQLITQENKGLSAARNAGIRNAKGDTIICIDSDDTIHPKMLKTLYSEIYEHCTQASFSGYKNVDVDFRNAFSTDKVKDGKRITSKKIASLFLRRKIKIIAPAILIKRDFFVENSLWFDETIKYSEDQHFIWRLLSALDCVVYNKAKFYNYLTREKSIMTSPNISNIKSGYLAIEKLVASNKFSLEFGRLIIARWVFAAVRVNSKRISYSDFKVLSHELNFNGYIHYLHHFPDWRVKAMSMLYSFSPSGFYKICSWRL